MSQRMILICLLVGLAAVLGWQLTRGKAKEAKFHQAQVSRGDIKVTVLATGIVQPQNRLEIKPPVAGRVEKIMVHEGQHVKKGQIIAYMSSSERAALLDAARAKGAEEVAHWEDLYKEIPIVAPLPAMVIARNVEPGQTVALTDALFVTSDRLIVKAQVDETDIAKIKLGQRVEISLDAYPKEVVDAKVDHIAFDAKTVSSVTIYEVEVLPEKIPAYMRSGMTATATFALGEKKNTLIVASEAIKQENGKSFVYVPSQSGKKSPIPQEVELGLTDGKRVEILAGMKEGETIMLPDLLLSKDSKKNKSSSPFMSINKGGK